MPKRPLRIAVTLGDPAGIGPEVSIKAVASLSSQHIIPILIGRKEIIKSTSTETIYHNYNPYKKFESCSLEPDKIYLFHEEIDLPIPEKGKGSIDTGKEALAYIDRAVTLWKDKHIDAIVTAPVSKSYIEKTGIEFSGHTEYLAKQIDEPNPYMMMYSSEYSVLLASTHIPLSLVTDYVTEERLLSVIRMGHSSMKNIKNREPKLAIAGMDPHCGDDGAIGHFDIAITSKAVKIAQAEGIDIQGPYAADTLFLANSWKNFDCVIAHYHDQGLIPFKMLAFDKGVNVTFGLSLVRTSPDHGTAYDIAGKNIASYESMREAILLAAELAAL